MQTFEFAEDRETLSAAKMDPFGYACLHFEVPSFSPECIVVFRRNVIHESVYYGKVLRSHEVYC